MSSYNYNSVPDLLSALGRIFFIISSLHPKNHEVDIVEDAFRNRFTELLQVGKFTLDDDPFLLHVPDEYRQITNNFADYLLLEAKHIGKDTYSVSRMPPQKREELSDDILED